MSTTDPMSAAARLWARRELIGAFTRREIEGRYRGSYLGVAWSLLTPLIMLGVYTFVFGVVFHSRWRQTADGDLGGYALMLFAGIVPFSVFSECVSRAPSLIISVPNYVKKTVFPLEILAVSLLGGALFHALISTAVLACATLVAQGSVHVTILLAPLALGPIALVALGLAWFLGSAGVYVRDIGHVVGLAVQVVFFLTPIVYPLDAVPAALRPLMLLNPLAPAIEDFRVLALGGHLPPLAHLASSWAVAAVVCWLGHAWFQATKRGFADVI